MAKERLKELTDGFNEASLALFEAVREIVKTEKPKTVLEIGSGWGVSASAFLLDTDIQLTSIDNQYGLKEFKKRVDIASDGKRLHWIYDDSYCWLRRSNEHYDLVFVDGGHDYEKCYFDIAGAWDRTRFLMVVDDFLHKNNFVGERTYGVTKAVLDFCSYKGRQVEKVMPTMNNGLAILRKRKK